MAIQSKMLSRAKFDELRSVAAATVPAAYATAGSTIGDPLEYPAVAILFQNLTNVTLVFSDDGVRDVFKLPQGGQFVLDCGSNKSNLTGWLAYGEGTQWYVRYQAAANPTSGEVCMSVLATV